MLVWSMVEALHWYDPISSSSIPYYQKEIWIFVTATVTIALKYKFNIHDVFVKVHTSVSVLLFIPDALVDIATLFSLDHSNTMLLGLLFSDEDSYWTSQVKLILPPTVIVISYGTTVTSNFNVPANEIYWWYIPYLPLFETCSMTILCWRGY